MFEYLDKIIWDTRNMYLGKTPVIYIYIDERSREDWHKWLNEARASYASGFGETNKEFNTFTYGGIDFKIIL